MSTVFPVCQLIPWRAVNRLLVLPMQKAFFTYIVFVFNYLFLCLSSAQKHYLMLYNYVLLLLLHMSPYFSSTVERPLLLFPVDFFVSYTGKIQKRLPNRIAVRQSVKNLFLFYCQPSVRKRALRQTTIQITMPTGSQSSAVRCRGLCRMCADQTPSVYERARRACVFICPRRAHC